MSSTDKEMKTLAFINPKGGVGKTSLVDQVAYRMQELGIAVELVDLDPQQGTYFNESSENPRIVLVDTRGSFDTGLDNLSDDETIAAVIEQCDYVAIPVQLDRDSEEPCAKVVSLAKAHGKPYKIMPNRTRMHYALDRAKFAEFSAVYPGNVSTNVVRDGAVVGQARDLFMSWSDVDKKSKTVADLNALVDELLVWMGVK